MKKAIVCGAGGFIGSHLVKKLKKEGFWVKGIDLKYPEFGTTEADEFVIGDLRDIDVCKNVINEAVDELYQLAGEVGGAGYVFTGENDAEIMHNSALINLNIVDLASKIGVKKLFYSSSACIYPQFNQEDPENPNCAESTAYPAFPDSEYGWEKLFSERIYQTYARTYSIKMKIARFHNIFGEEGTYTGGREKAPAALCRKIAETNDGGTIDIWGDGKQTRSFLYIDECLEGVRKLMDSGFDGPVNIGSEEMVSIDELAYKIANIAGKKILINHIDGPMGVRGRNSDNTLINKELSWKPSKSLEYGLKKTYFWINKMVNSNE
ncbi:NAD-dependent epimerase/dehydratase family protein [bacterium]|nr:NAD-dependent epimerase/dehydratase family protein [bacterium]